MTPERWQRIEELYHAALECAVAERTALLAEAGAGDEALRREVEILLAANAQADQFLSGHALEREAAKVVAQQQAIRAGQQLNRYRILSPRGGRDGRSLARRRYEPEPPGRSQTFTPRADCRC
jgi:hypothetical protein